MKSMLKFASVVVGSLMTKRTYIDANLPISGEKPGKPMFRVKEIATVSLWRLFA